MESEELYSRLQRIGELERKISAKGKKEFGDPDAMEYNTLVNSIKILSPSDLMAYHNFMIKEMEKEEESWEKEKEALRTELRTETLRVLRDICFPRAYSEIESALEEVYN